MNILKFLSKKEAVIYCRCSRKSRKEHIPYPFELFGIECGKGWYKQ